MHNIKHRWRHEQLEPPVQREEEVEEEEEDIEIEPKTPMNITQLIENEESRNSDDNLNRSQSWAEWMYSLFWKSLGY